MKRLSLLLIPLALLMSSTAMAADLDGPVYRERRTTVIEHPPIVERRIIEHHYYEPAPRTVYVDEDYYEPRVYGYYARPWPTGWHRHHRHFRHHHWRGHRHDRW